LLKEIKQAVMKSNVRTRKVIVGNKQSKHNVVEILMNEQEVEEMKEVSRELPKPLIPQHNDLKSNTKPKSILRDTSNKQLTEVTSESIDVNTIANKFIIPNDLSAINPNEQSSSMNLECDKVEDEDKEIKDYLKNMIKGKKLGTPSFGTPRKKSELTCT
jgi:hypothetical protein